MQWAKESDWRVGFPVRKREKGKIPHPSIRFSAQGFVGNN